MVETTKRLLLLLILCTSLFMLITYNTQPLFGYPPTSFSIQADRLEYIKSLLFSDKLPHSSNQTCNPFLPNFSQYRVEIENEMYPKSVPMEYNKSINFECLNRSQQQKKPLILFWNQFFGQTHFLYESSEKLRERGCPVYNCDTTNDKSRWDEASLVVTHMRDGGENFLEKIKFPKHRPSNLRTVFLLYESPMHSEDMTKYKVYFIMTSSFPTSQIYFSKLMYLIYRSLIYLIY